MSAGRNAKRSAAARALRPIRRGIGATSVELPEGPWSTLGEWAVDRFGEAALAVFADAGFVAVRLPLRDDRGDLAHEIPGSGNPGAPGGAYAASIPDDGGQFALSPETPYVAGSRIWIHRPVPDEPPAPIVLEVVAETERFVVVDKPHGLATMPRGSHAARTVVVAARRQFGNDDLVAAHRLDAATAGLVLLVKHPEHRGAYQELFARREVVKLYRAVVEVTDLALLKALGDAEPEGSADYSGPVFRCGTVPPLALADLPEGRVELAMVKERGSLQARVAADEANAVTNVEPLGASGNLARFRLKPLTGRTHQLRLTMAHLGAPIAGDWLYPEVTEPGDLPLQLLAEALAFTDPIDGSRVEVKSRRRLALEDEVWSDET